MTEWPDWALRPGRVVRVNGDLTGLVDDPAVIMLTCTGFELNTARDLVEAIVDEVTEIVLNLYPLWLDGHPTDTHNSLDVHAAEVRARQLCRDTDNFAPFVVALARASAGRTRYRPTEPVEARWAGLMRLIRRAYGREAVVVYLAPEATPRIQASTADWLAQHGAVSVWLGDADGSEGSDLDRFPMLCLTVDSATDDTEPVQLNCVTISRCEGMPAPHSAAEQHLERALARCAWAGERRWNRGVDGLPVLAPSIIVDLQWSAARVIVEVDGADHRAPDKYTADRIRDNILQTAGFMVLRYTNEQVLDDVDVVVAGLRQVIVDRTEGIARGTRTTGNR